MERILTTVAVVCLAAGVSQQLPAQNIATTSNRSSVRSSRGATSLAPTAAETSASGQYPQSELEDLRTQLLNLTDAVGEMSALAPSAADPDTVQQAKTGIQQMSSQHLNVLRQAISPSKLSTRITGSRQSLKAYSEARVQGGVQGKMNGHMLSPLSIVDNTAFPSVTEFCMSQGSSVSTGQPGSSGFGASGTSNGQSATTQNPTPGSDQGVSSPTGGTYDPGSIRIPTAAVLAADVVRFVADTVKDLSQDACKEDILGFNASLACLVVDALAVVADAVDEGIHFCDDDLTGNVIDTSYVGIKDVHDDLFTVDGDIDTNITNATTNINGNITAAYNNTTTNINNATTNIDNNVNAKIAALTTVLQTLVANLSSQVAASTGDLLANLQQIMKLQMTPQGQEVINLSVLTCDGTAAHPCPTPLAACLAAGKCSWNNVGPLP